MRVEVVGAQHTRRKLRVVGRIGVALRFERDSPAIAYRATVFPAVGAVEEVAAVELQRNLVALNLYAAPARGVVEVGNDDHRLVVRTVDDPVVVISRAMAQLLVALTHALAYGVRLAEVERRTLDRHNLARRNHQRIDWRYVRGVDAQLVVENRAVALAVQIKKRVVREVHDRRCVGRGGVCYDKFVVRRERVFHLYFAIAGEAVLPVGQCRVEDNLALADRLDLPHYAVDAERAAVQRLTVVVLRQRVLLAVERKATARYAIGAWPYGSPQKPLARVVCVATDAVVADFNVGIVAVAVGYPQRHDARAVVGYLHHHIAPAQRVQPDLRPTDFCVEFRRVEQRNLFLLGACARSKQ